MDEKESNEEGSTSSPLLFSYRSFISLVMWCYITLTYMQRFNLSVAIVCMINHTDLSLRARSNGSETVKFSDCDQPISNQTVDMEVRNWRFQCSLFSNVPFAQRKPETLTANHNPSFP